MNRNTTTVAKLLGVVVFMGGLAWASVPLYDWFCRVTGFGGTTSMAEAGSDEILDRTITIKFDASLERGMPWEFRPVQREMEIRIGETGLAFYEAYNPTDQGLFHEDRLLLLRIPGAAARRARHDARELFR